MDGVSSGRLACILGVSVPTVHRAVARLELGPPRTAGGHMRFRPEEVVALISTLGVAPRVDGLSREDVFVLTALARSPLGLRSARAVARASGVSPTTARRSLDGLVSAGLALHDRKRFVEGSVVEGELWRARVTSARWAELAPALSRVILPTRGDVRRERFPRRLAHLLWNADLARVDRVEHGAYLASRLLTSGDPQAAAWASANLSAAAIRSVVGLRGVPADRQALAENLAAAR
ncbi:MAG: helix-turn-helix domain-containing protein [Acidimicrobiales bacterium]